MQGRGGPCKGELCECVRNISMFYHFSITWVDEEKGPVACSKIPDALQTITHSKGKKIFLHGVIFVILCRM